MNARPRPTSADIDAFIERWQHAPVKECANYQLFLAELAQLLGLRRSTHQKLPPEHLSVPGR